MDKYNILDKYGLLVDGGILVIKFPSVNAILPLRVKYRENRGYEIFEYGPLPFNYSGYDSGVIPAGIETESITFPYNLLPEGENTDLFFFKEKNKVIHAHLYFEPKMLRILTEIPQGVKTYSLYGRITQDLKKDFGWFRSKREMIFLPNIHIGWKFYNPTNMDLRTYLKIIYGEYRVELVTDVNYIYDILRGKIPSHKIIFGGAMKNETFNDAVNALGVECLEALVPEIPPNISREQAIKLIQEKVNTWRR